MVEVCLGWSGFVSAVVWNNLGRSGVVWADRTHGQLRLRRRTASGRPAPADPQRHGAGADVRLCPCSALSGVTGAICEASTKMTTGVLCQQAAPLSYDPSS